MSFSIVRMDLILVLFFKRLFAENTFGFFFLTIPWCIETFYLMLAVGVKIETISNFFDIQEFESSKNSVMVLNPEN